MPEGIDVPARGRHLDRSTSADHREVPTTLVYGGPSGGRRSRTSWAAPKLQSRAQILALPGLSAEIARNQLESTTIWYATVRRYPGFLPANRYFCSGSVGASHPGGRRFEPD